MVPDTKRAKIAGVIDEKVTEIGLKVIPYNEDEETKDLKMSINLFTEVTTLLQKLFK